MKLQKFFQNPNNYRKAFSFVEIAVVILIVAVTLIGVMQGRELYLKMRLNSARVLTERSQVQNIENLALWLETTLEESLYLTSSDTASPRILSDDQTIGRWNDLNIDKNLKNNFLQNTDANRPKYKMNGINGLPSLIFDGNDFMQNANIFYYNNFTVFVVAMPLKTCNNTATVHFGTEGQNYVIYPSQGNVVNSGAGSAGFGISLCQNQIVTVEHSSNYMPARNFLTRENRVPVLITVVYKNKVPMLYVNSKSIPPTPYQNSLIIGSVSESSYNVFPTFRIAGGSSGSEGPSFFGHIGEVIYYSSVLKDDDRKLIEAYLTEKWQIK